jgi:hypothetical protein
MFSDIIEQIFRILYEKTFTNIDLLDEKTLAETQIEAYKTGTVCVTFDVWFTRRAGETKTLDCFAVHITLLSFVCAEPVDIMVEGYFGETRPFFWDIAVTYRPHLYNNTRLVRRAALNLYFKTRQLWDLKYIRSRLCAGDAIESTHQCPDDVIDIIKSYMVDDSEYYSMQMQDDAEYIEKEYAAMATEKHFGFAPIRNVPRELEELFE